MAETAAPPEDPDPRADPLRDRRAVPPPGLQRDRPQAGRRRGRGAVRLALPPLPRRQAGARRGGDRDGRRLLPGARHRRLRRGADARGSVRAVFAGAAETLEATDYEDACPIETVALEVASTDERLREATAAVFARWTEALTERLGDRVRGAGRHRRARGRIHPLPRVAQHRADARGRRDGRGPRRPRLNRPPNSERPSANLERCRGARAKRPPGRGSRSSTRSSPRRR